MDRKKLMGLEKALRAAGKEEKYSEEELNKPI